MDSLCRLKFLLLNLWIGACFVPSSHQSDGNVNHLSKEDVLLLKDEPDPKCFTRTGEDFTCFIETKDNKTHDLLYMSQTWSGQTLKRCEMPIRPTDRGTFLHTCSFPDADVLLYMSIRLQVVERTSNKSLNNRTVNVEEHFLLNPPYDVSLHPNGQVGQLRVSWLSKTSQYLGETTMHRIQYSYGTHGEKIGKSTDDDTLDDLVTGEEVEAQVAIKCDSHGHWSGWSHSARALVPQSADDVSMECFTSDLHNVTCQWDGGRYEAEEECKLFYQTLPSKPSRWSEWAECLPEFNVTDQCRFDGEVTRKIKVKLGGASATLGRTFYSQEFNLNSSIKTLPLRRLTGKLKKKKLCLNWEAPLSYLQPHLEYEVDYRIAGGDRWKATSGPQTEACVEVPAGSRYSVKVRAKPAGSVYSGQWSDWSPVVTGDTPSDISVWLSLCIPLLLLITVIILFGLFSTYVSKLKHYFWPPVPNLDKVLQGYLSEIDRQTWDPPASVKLCNEETTSSVVEVISEDKVSKATEESTKLLSAEGSLSSLDQVDRVDQVFSPGVGGYSGTEVSPAYVTLNKDCVVVVCPQGNSYVCEQVRDEGGPGETLTGSPPCPRPDDSTCAPPASVADFLNRSYLCHAEPAGGPGCKVEPARSAAGNRYTNFPYS